MAYQFTFTRRFQKHFQDLTALEKKQLRNKLELLAENPFIPLFANQAHSRHKGFIRMQRQHGYSHHLVL